MSAPQFTPGPWFGPNYNNSTAEPTRALTGKFKPRGHKTPNDYVLRVEVSGDNVAADARLIAAAPRGYTAADNSVARLETLLAYTTTLTSDDQAVVQECVDDLRGFLAQARGEQ